MERESISDLVSKQIGQVERLTLNLSQVLTDYRMNIVGRAICIWDAPSQNEVIYIRFNNRWRPQIPFRMGKTLGTPFDKIFLTVPAGLTGTMEILYGPDAYTFLRFNPAIQVIETGAGTDYSAVLNGIRDELQGDQADEGYGQQTIGVAQSQVLAANADRKGFSIQAKSTNGEIVYVGFDNGVTANNWWAELQAGQSCGLHDYRGPLHAIASAGGQLIGVGEW